MKDFDSLMETGTSEAISEAYEQLLRSERGNCLEFSSRLESPAVIDWGRLEGIALTATPLERAESFLGESEKFVNLPVVVVAFLAVLAGLTFTAVWAQNQIYSDTASIPHLFFVGFVVLSLLSLGMIVLGLGIAGLTLRYSQRFSLTGRMEPAAWGWLQRGVVPAMACALVVSGAFIGGRTGAGLSPLFSRNLRLPASVAAYQSAAAQELAKRNAAFTAGLASFIYSDSNLLKLLNKGAEGKGITARQVAILRQKILAQPEYREKILSQWKSTHPGTYALVKDSFAPRSEQSEIGVAMHTLAVADSASINITDPKTGPVKMDDPRWKGAFSAFTLAASDALTTENPMKSPGSRCTVDSSGGSPKLNCSVDVGKRTQPFHGTIMLDKLEAYRHAVKLADVDRAEAVEKLKTTGVF